MTMGRKEAHMITDQIMVVACEGDVNDWAAYMAPVFGVSYDADIERVTKRGRKIDRNLAEFLFPEWKTLSWRD